jgi:transcriptional regulator NrdR family protein
MPPNTDGSTCPECKSTRTVVMTTRDSDPRHVVRYRNCLDCSCHFKTTQKRNPNGEILERIIRIPLVPRNNKTVSK